MKAYFVIISLVSLSACSSSKLTRAGFPDLVTKKEVTEIYSPIIGTKHEAMIGDSLFSKMIKQETQNKVVTLLSNSNADMDNGYSISLKYGQTSKLYTLNKQHHAFCDNVLAKSASFLFLGKSAKSCLVDLDNNGDFESASFSGYKGVYPLNRSIKYNVTDLTPKIFFREDEFRREAIYQGVSNNTIKVLFREYKNNYIRDSFSQTIFYDLDSGGETLIAFKGFQAKIHKASGTNITYTVTSPFLD